MAVANGSLFVVLVGCLEVGTQVKQLFVLGPPRLAVICLPHSSGSDGV